MAKGARGLTWFWSNNYLVLPELEVNQLSSKTAEAAVNATNLTNPVVTLEAEVANPWRARCLETCTSGSEGGVRKRAEEQRALPLPYSGLQPTGNHAPVSRPCLMGQSVMEGG
jgi:hypothetical protein